MFLRFFEALSVTDGLNEWICWEEGDVNLMGKKISVFAFWDWTFFKLKTDVLVTLITPSDSSKQKLLCDIIVTLYTTKDNPQTFCFSASNGIFFVLYFLFI